MEEKFSLNGRFKNVVLSEAELQELMTLFPWDYQKRIDHLSVYMKSSGKSIRIILQQSVFGQNEMEPGQEGINMNFRKEKACDGK